MPFQDVYKEKTIKSKVAFYQIPTDFQNASKSNWNVIKYLISKFFLIQGLKSQATKKKIK